MPETSTSSVKKVKNSSSTFSPLGDLIGKSWEMVKLSWKNLLILSIILWVVGLALGAVAGGAIVGSLVLSGPMGEMAAGTIGTAIVFGVLVVLGILVLSSVFGTAMMIAVGEAEKRPAVGSLISRGFKLFVPVFLTTLLLVFFVYGGFILLIIPGIVIAILTGFSMYEVVFTKNRYLTAIKNSVKMVSQNFSELLVRVLVVFGLMIGLVIVQSILINMVGGEESSAAPLVSLVMGIAQMVFGWFAMCYYYLIYSEARSATDFNRSGSIVWMWIVATLGWILGVFLLITASSAIGNIMQNYSKSEMESSGNVQQLMNENDEVDAELLLEQYGQDMTEEEKEMFRQMMQGVESAMEDEPATTQPETN